MTERTIYLLVGERDYEGCEPLKAFAREADARAAEAACEAYRRTEPRWSAADSPESWRSQLEAWKAAHPVCREASGAFDRYSVEAIPFADAQESLQ